MNHVHLRVSIGDEISADQLPRVFDKFYRIPNADPRKQGGTGLAWRWLKTSRTIRWSNFSCRVVRLPLR